jgi:hypothetical protein
MWNIKYYSPFVMSMQENLAEFELNQSLVGLCSRSTWSNGRDFLDSLSIGQQRKFLESRNLSLLYNSSVEMVEAARSNILVRRACSIDIFGYFHTARLNQGFINSVVSSDPSSENRVIVCIRERCVAAGSSGWGGEPGGPCARQALLPSQNFKLQCPLVSKN